MNNIDVTIVIVNWNSRDMLRDCIYSIIKYNNMDSIKIIVVDNDSSDNSAEMVNELFSFVTLIKSGGNIGFARANNLAIPHINGSLTLFLNPDTLVCDGSINKMVQFIKNNNEVGLVSCKLKYPSDQTVNIGTDGGAQTLALQWFPSPCTALISILLLTDRNIQRFKKLLPYHDPNKSGYVTMLMGTCMMIKRNVLDCIGGFDERFFMYGEDGDLCKRIHDNGWKLYYMSEAEIVHVCGGSSKRNSNEFMIMTRCESIRKFMEKYYGISGSILYRFVILFGSSVRIVVMLIINAILLLLSKNRNLDLYESIKKYYIMLKWSINYNDKRLS